MTAVTTTQQLEAIVREDIERIWNEGDLSFVDEQYADDSVLHDAFLPEEVHDQEGYKSYVQEFRKTFPDLEVTADQIVTGDDTVAVRYSWHPPRGTHGYRTHRKTGRGTRMVVVRFEDGKVREDWIIDDSLGLLQQLGGIELPGE